MLAATTPGRVGGAGLPAATAAAAVSADKPGRGPSFLEPDAGGTYPAVFNASNEQLVAAFHAGAIGFLDIVDTIARVVDAHKPDGELTLPSLAEAELWARAEADRAIAALR